MRSLTRAALLVVLAAAPLRAADEPPDRTGDLQPVMPLSRTRFGEFRNYGRSDGAFVLSPGGKTLVTAGGNIVVYDLAAGRGERQPRLLNADAGNFYGAAVAFSADGKTLAGVPAQHADDQAVRFWDVATGKEVRQIDNDETFFSLALSPDGKLLALGGQQKVEIWDAATGDEVRVLPGAQNAVYQHLAFSADGRMLATVGTGPTVHLWEVAAGKQRAEVRFTLEPALVAQVRYRRFVPGGAEENGISAMAFSADGRLLAVGGTDNSIRLWDLRRGVGLPPLLAHDAPVTALSFPPDGKTLVSVDTDGTRLVWSLSRVRRAAAVRPGALGEEEFAELWDDLAEADAFRAYRAARYLEADPRRALALLAKHLEPVPAGDSAVIGKLVADLQSPSGSVRRRAMAGLRKQGESALGALNQLGMEQRQNRATLILMAKLQAQYNTPRRQRALKALQVLEKIGSAEARQFLGRLARGAAGVNLTTQAKAALDRLTAAGAGGRPKAADPDRLWADLTGDDAGKAFEAARGLAARPREAVALLEKNVRPVAPADARKIEKWIADLEDDEFAVREKAAGELAKLGEAAGPSLKKALAGSPPAEARKRIERLLEPLTNHRVSGPALRGLRAVEVLEWIDTPGSRRLLETLAGGAPGARLTDEARAALKRLGRPAAKPRAPG